MDLVDLDNPGAIDTVISSNELIRYIQKEIINRTDLSLEEAFIPAFRGEVRLMSPRKRVRIEGPFGTLNDTQWP